MNEKVVNPIGENDGPHKSSTSSILVYQNGWTLDFGQDYAGCPVYLLLNDVMVFSTIVGSDGLVMIPDSFIGIYELQIIIDTRVYSALIEL